MHRKVRQYLKKSLCGILTAAMIFTSLSVPDMTVHAAEVEGTEETELTEAVETTEQADGEETTEPEEAVEDDVDGTGVEKSASDSSKKTPTDEDETDEEVVDNDVYDANTEENITLYVYAEDYTPAIVVANDSPLTYVKEDKSTDNLPHDSANADGNNYGYNMKAVDGQNNWFELTFIAPNSCKLYAVSEGTYTWKKDFGDKTQGDWMVDFSPVFEGETYYKNGVFYDSFDCTVDTKTLKELRDLLASSVVSDAVSKGDAYYLEASWDAFSTAKETAENELKKCENEADDYTSADIETAYNALQKAIDELWRGITFYYYIGSTDQEVGAVKYGNISSSKQGYESWIWSDTAYVMDEVADTGWYSVELYLPSAKEGTGFAVYLKNETKKYQCVTGWDGNPEHYEKLISGEAQSYAVDGKGILYQGTGDIISAIDQIDRNVILHVYSENGTPAIVTSSQLSTVTDGDGVKKIEQLSANKEDTANSKYYYDMKKDAADSNWYSLTFLAPEADSSKVICDLYIKGDDGSYTQEASFTDGTTSGNNTIDFNPVLKGTNTYYNNGELFSDSALATGVSMSDLEKEYNKYKDYKASKYTEESWNVFSDALDAAKSVIDRGEQAASEDIKKVYNDLKEAAEKLELAGIEFYYYVGDTNGKEVGVYRWNMEFNADAATWHPWGNEKETAYKMTKSDYQGWYSIQIKPTETPSEDANFQIFVESDLNTPIFKCGSEKNNENGGNSAIYDKLYSGSHTTYAVKEYGEGENEKAVLYEGSGAEAAMRNITLYAYSDNGTPAIGSKSKLSAASNDGALTEIEVTATTANIFYYQMKGVIDKPNWYALTFSMPVFDENTDIGLYILNGENYTLDKKFSETDEEGYVNITPVFAGNIYYKDGKLYESEQYAEGITLKQLRELLASEEVQAIVDKGADKYTPESWQLFQEAKTKAEAVIAKCEETEETNKENYTSPDITDAFSALQTAVSSIKEKENVVTFYYYNDSIAAGDELGLVFWSGDNSKSTADKPDWHVWNEQDKIYAMKAVDGYEGWYSIPIVFVPTPADKYPGFTIHKKSDAVNGKTDAIDTFSNDNNNYPILNDGATVYAVKNGKSYQGEELVNLLMRNVTFYAYSAEGIPSIGTANEITAYVDERTGNKVTVSRSAQADGINYYDMKAAEDEGWYVLSFSAPSATDTKEIGKLYTKKDSAYSAVITLLEGAASAENTVDFTKYFGRTVYFKNGSFYDSLPITIEDLRSLIEKAVKLKEDDEKAEQEGRRQKYLHDNDEGKWAAFVSEIDKAKAVADKTGAEDNEIEEAYRRLEAAIGALVYIPQNAESISVERVAVPENFITGADLSSYVALKESGTVFKDMDGNALSDSGFFKMLYEGGTNWVRIRVWNDPYNSNGNGYGGGNSDLEKAKIIGKLATDAGMSVLIDFHYSDFWADPAKQDTPKAWEGYTLEQKKQSVYDFTLSSLRSLKSAGVNVGMVQVGNETNNAICGEKGWANMSEIFNAGSRAVRDFDASCLVAVHFADPSDGNFSSYSAQLDKYSVDYDVFAASYYPFWHGTTENLINKLTEVAKNYGKKVMVAETSWVTTWEDGDGHGNTSPKTSQTLNYPVSVQGQADEMRDVINAVNAVNSRVNGNPAIGVFYWEPAWVSPYYVYNGDVRDEALYSKNKELWEQYGSGWASSYSAEYDPSDAGLWYGGSAVDNQAWFDFNGKALETSKVYSYIKTGAVAENRTNAIANVEREMELKLGVGETIPWPDGSKVVVTFSDGSKATDTDDNRGTHLVSTKVKWNEQQQALVNTDKVAEYTVNGTATCEYYETDGQPETKKETYNITLFIKVASTSNILVNAGFEEGKDPWVVTPLDGTIENVAEVSAADPHSGDAGMHFWSSDILHFTLEQQVTGLKAGSYTFGGFIQGGGASSKDLQRIYVTVVDKNGGTTVYKKNCSLNGYLNWVNPEITNVKISEGDTMKVGMEIHSTVAGAWGTIDDMYLYGRYGIELGVSEHGIINVSNMEPDSGEVIRIAAMPDNGYYLSQLKISSESGVSNSGLKDESGTGKTAVYDEASRTAVLTYNAGDVLSDAALASFIMPGGIVTVDAVFEKISFDTAVSLDQVTVKGFTAAEDGKFICDVPQEYTGQKIEPELDLSYAGYKLTSADYTAKYKDNKDVTSGGKMAEITLTAKGNKFTGTRTLYFNIVDNKVDISKAKAKLKENIYYYTGDEIEPVIVGLTDKNGSNLKTKDGSADLVVTTDDYTVYYEKNSKVGKAVMTVIANSNSAKIKGAFTQNFTIAKCPITDSHITVTKISGGTYTGGKVTPNVTVKYDNRILQKGKDYTVSYKNNVKVSKDASAKPTLKITGKGSYTGTTKDYTFEIMPKNLNDFGIKVTASAIAKGAAPKITVKNKTAVLSLDKQYMITKIVCEAAGENPEKVIYDKEQNTGTKPNAKINETGTYKATLEGIEKNGYTGTRTVAFKVVGSEYLLSNAKIKITSKTRTYTGGEITLDASELSVTSKDGKPLNAGEHYTVSYNDADGAKTNIKAGKATVTITAKEDGDYAGEKSASFTISKKDIASAGIRLEANKDDMLALVKDNALPYTGYAWKPEYNIYAVNGDNQEKLLINGTDYTVSYKKNLKPGDEAVVTVKGKGNYSGTVSKEKVFKVKDVTLDDFVIAVNPVEYSGKALKPVPNFIYKETGTSIELKPGAAYTAKYSNNKEVASIANTNKKPTITITEKGLNASAAKSAKKVIPLEFTITTARIHEESISEIKIQTYKGKPVKPVLKVKVNGKNLKAGKDYIVLYRGNTFPNRYAAAEVIGIGSYYGKVSKTFVIK